nr:MAG TPA: hypothetical protein [Bacteriophage sp.]
MNLKRIKFCCLFVSFRQQKNRSLGAALSVLCCFQVRRA